jgi:cell division protein FtsW
LKFLSSKAAKPVSFIAQDWAASGANSKTSGGAAFASGSVRVGSHKFLDPVLTALVLILISFGLLMVYSATGVAVGEKYGDSLIFVRKQAIACIIGFGLFALTYFFSLEKLRRFAPYALAIAICCAVLPLLPGIGAKVGGASRWLIVGPVRLQTGEFAKLFSVIFLAGYYSRNELNLHKFTVGLLAPFLMLTPVFIGLLAQPDFGSCAVIALVAITMGCAAGIKLRYLIIGTVVLAVLGGLLIWLEPYRAKRVVSFLSPTEDASGSGYQLIQSLIAVGTGELTGVGLGASQQKLFFLPAAHTDFIFALICEELGFIGAMALLSAFLIFLLRGFKIASNHYSHTFEFTLAVGITTLVILPALLNIGVVIGVLPTKGLVLPLVGYGGSAVMMYLAALGLLFQLAGYKSVSRNR